MDIHRVMVCVHILGASGSGTTTLGGALAARLGCEQHDVDDYFWLPDDPPYQRRRPMPDRLRLLGARLDDSADWVLSGSLVGWGDPLVPRFDMVVYLSLDPALRMARLRMRERQRHGDRILPGGDRAGIHAEFMAWAADYDTAGLSQRSRARHDAWLADLPGRVLRLDAAEPVESLAEAVLRAMPRQGRRTRQLAR
jgi:hypothetical protein